MNLHIEFVCDNTSYASSTFLGREYFKKYNNILSLHMYRFIIKATRPVIFLRFAHLYV